MKKLNNNELYLLIHIIKFNGNLKKLIRNDISYVEIVKNMKVLIEDKYLSYEEGKLNLTEEGEKLYIELSKKYKNTDKNKWIEKELQSKIEKLDIDFIYLPNQNELYF